jgi:hypothetical protein
VRPLVNIRVLLFIAFMLAMQASDSDCQQSTIYRSVPAARHVADLDVADFFDNMESGSLVNLKKAGPGSFIFEVQDNKIYGYQGTLMVWFYGMCDLRNVEVEAGDKLKMALRWPVGLTKVRPVYSYDSINWNFVPEGWGRDGDVFRFDLPLQSGQSRIYFSTHYPYPPQRVLERAIEQAKSRYVRAIETIGRGERDRPTIMLTITDPAVPDRKKKPILLSAGDHPGETASLWGMEGSIDFLLSDNAVAKNLRQRTIIYVVPLLAMDGFALGTDRRQATGVNIYFDYQKFESREARFMWETVKRVRPSLWLDYHSWHLGIAEGLYGPDPKIIGSDKFAPVKPLIDAVGKHFPINQRGPDTLDSPNTQALLQLGIPGFCPEFNFGKGATGDWKTIEDQKILGSKIVLGIQDYLSGIH